MTWQVFLGNNGLRDIDGNELPQLVYVSREKRPGFDHHKKAGAMNALVGSIFQYHNVYHLNDMMLDLFVFTYVADSFWLIQGAGISNHLKCSLDSEC